METYSAVPAKASPVNACSESAAPLLRWQCASRGSERPGGHVQFAGGDKAQPQQLLLCPLCCGLFASSAIFIRQLWPCPINSLKQQRVVRRASEIPVAYCPRRTAAWAWHHRRSHGSSAASSTVASTQSGSAGATAGAWRALTAPTIAWLAATCAYVTAPSSYFVCDLDDAHVAAAQLVEVAAYRASSAEAFRQRILERHHNKH